MNGRSIVPWLFVVGACSSSSSPTTTSDAGSDSTLSDVGDSSETSDECTPIGGRCILVATEALGHHCPAGWTDRGTCGPGTSPNTSCCVPPPDGGKSGTRCTAAGGACNLASASCPSTASYGPNDCPNPSSTPCCLAADAGDAGDAVESGGG